MNPHPPPPPSPSLISPRAQIQSLTAALLRRHSSLSLTQLLIWVEEAHNRWRDREEEVLPDFLDDPFPTDNQDFAGGIG